MDGAAVPDRIEALLRAAGVAYDLIEHPAATSAEQAAAARGTPLEIGGKSLVMKLDRGIGFAVMVIGGDRRIDNAALRRHLRVRRYRFATPEELRAVTGLTPGCVPPFGRPIFDLPLYVDADVVARAEIAFSAGTHTRSIRAEVAGWLAAAQPADVFAFCRPGCSTIRR